MLIDNLLLITRIEAHPETRGIMEYLFSAARHWPTYEWFYPTIDRDYFNESEFKGCLQMLDLEHVCHISYVKTY